jgi:hypothetical protein
VKSLYERKAQFLLQGRNRHKAVEGGLPNYVGYLRYLHSTLPEETDKVRERNGTERCVCV